MALSNPDPRGGVGRSSVHRQQQARDSIDPLQPGPPTGICKVTNRMSGPQGSAGALTAGSGDTAEIKGVR